MSPINSSTLLKRAAAGSSPTPPLSKRFAPPSTRFSPADPWSPPTFWAASYVTWSRREELSHLDLQELTDREREVFRLAAEGARKDEIGQRLFISPDTARTHLQRVYRKLGVHSQAELIALAARDTRARGDDP